MFARYSAPIAVLLAGTTFAGAQSPADPAGEIAATVNGESIRVRQVDAALDASLASVPLSSSQRRQLRKAVVEDLIDDVLVRQFLDKHGAKVEPAEIEAQMTALRAQLIHDNQTLAQYLKQSGQTEAQLRAAWATQIQLANHVKQQATDEKLRAYHAANRDHFDRVEVRVSHILIRVSRHGTAVEKAAAREKLQSIRDDISRGKLRFSEAARKFSHCPSARKDGDLGHIRRRNMPEDEPLAQAAFALKVGELSDIVATDRGFHLLTVTERKPGSPSVLEKCIVEVLECYTEDFRIELVKRLRGEGQVKILLP